ncbi:MAG: CapA family protein [Firmicutes bacterium]|nr:CapA family protein [Alicyclobacillaceae bacterium]MCL6497614.1 CapA family protein [Bacillota bacterium]
MPTISLQLVGDINLKRDLRLNHTALDRVAEVLDPKAVRLGNLEGCFADPAVELPYKPGWYHCEPEMVECLLGRFDAVACANNVHYGSAIAESNRRLDAAGILHAGAGASLAEARRPAIVERDGVRVGLLAFTSVFWPVGHAATDHSPGVATIKGHTAYAPHPRVFEMPGAPAVVRSWPDPEELEAACAAIRALRPQVQVVVVYLHWGVTGSSEVAEYQPAIAHRAIDAGADVVVGSHPHVLQPVEFYRHGVIFYSLGNFIFGWRLHRHLTQDGLLAEVSWGQGTVEAVAVVPVQRNAEDQVVPLDPRQGEGARLAETVARLSAPFGTVTEVAGHAVRLRPERS